MRRRSDACLTTVRPTTLRSRTVLTRAALTATVIGLVLTPTAASATPSQGEAQAAVLALGDSYAAGEGLSANWPNDTNRDCNRSTVAWPSLARRVATNLNADLGGSIRWNDDAQAILSQRGAKVTAKPLVYEACSGATFARTDFDRKAHDHDAQQLATQVRGTDKYQMVTLSMGGNDLGFAPIIEDCIIDYGLKAVEGSNGAPNMWWAIAQGLVNAETSASCNQDWNKVGSDSNNILSDMDVGLVKGSPEMSLSEVYEWILSKKVAKGGTLTITTYPNLFADPADWPEFHLGRCGAISARDASGIREVTAIANQRIVSAASEADASVATASIEVVHQDELFEGHELCGPAGEWLYGARSVFTNVLNGCSGTGAYLGFRKERAFHPTCDAHQVTGATVGVLMAKALRNAAPNPSPGDTSTPANDDPDEPPTDERAAGPTTSRGVDTYCRALETRQSEILDRYNQGRARTQQAEDLAEIFNAGADQIGTFLTDLDQYLNLAADNAPPEIEDITEVLSNEITAGDGGMLAAFDFALDYMMLADQISVVDGYTQDACGFGF